MHSLLTLVRALHFASLFTLAGGLAFAALIAEPALRRHPEAGGAAAFRREIFRLAWLGLGLGIVSGLLWLALEAASMSGRPLADALSPGILGTVLNRTHFGRDWELRGALALPLILCLAIAARRRSALAFWTALALSAAALATIAGAGHAAAGTGGAGSIRLAADAIRHPPDPLPGSHRYDILHRRCAGRLCLHPLGPADRSRQRAGRRDRSGNLPWATSTASSRYPVPEERRHVLDPLPWASVMMCDALRGACALVGLSPWQHSASWASFS